MRSESSAGVYEPIYLKGPQCWEGLYLTMAKMVGSMHRKSMNSSMAR